MIKNIHPDQVLLIMHMQSQLKTIRGFTLLEIIIVIIIVGILASLALPKMFKTVEFSRSTEALQSISSLRQSIERCYLWSGDYANCTDISKLDMTDPTSSPGAHFGYTIIPSGSRFGITAIRNNLNGGTTGDFIMINYNTAPPSKIGSGAFASIK